MNHGILAFGAVLMLLLCITSTGLSLKATFFVAGFCLATMAVASLVGK